MDPLTQFCANPACQDKGRIGAGNIRIHSRTKRRYRCRTCRKTFAATTGTVFFRLHHPAELVTLVVTLLCHGCPLQAIVAGFGLDERTVTSWWERAGAHCQTVHTHLVQSGQVDLGHVQADELWIKVRGGRLWQAMAMAVPSRLWVGGIISPHRDGTLIRALLQQVRACATSLAVLVCVDGLSSYVTAVKRVFAVPIHTGRRGRPRLVLPETVLLGQVIKRYARRHVVSVEQRAVIGTMAAITRALESVGGGTQINTAYIERLNATFRAALAPLARRNRRLARRPCILTAGMYVVGTAYNFCWRHRSLRHHGDGGRKERTPAMAAGVTDHCWSMHEVLTYRVPPARWVPPKRRGRSPTPRPAEVAA
jgi:transposase-like protein